VSQIRSALLTWAFSGGLGACRTDVGARAVAWDEAALAWVDVQAVTRGLVRRWGWEWVLGRLWRL
jgi:hypothetical protein